MKNGRWIVARAASGKYLLLLALLSACASAAAEAPAPMSMTFSFHAAKDPCTGYFQSPEIRLRDVPAGATSVRVILTQKGTELGGQEVALSMTRIVPAGAIHTFGPCKPGAYTYTATVKSSLGQILSEARQSRLFPGDEIVE